MRVAQLGEGDPELAIVGGIHGDEPCGRRAVERLIEESPEVGLPVKLVVANERALEQGTRYVDEDLNRAFPGDPDGGTHESRLAHRLVQELRGCTVFSLHSTRSYPAPFALVDGLDAAVRSVCPYLSVEAVVETAGFSMGRLIAYSDVVEVECGLQGTEDAARNALMLCREFLAATGALASESEPKAVHDVPVFRLERQLPKPTDVGEFEVFVENFERVDEGEEYAAANGRAFVAEEPFYPVLLSAYGYRNVFGYSASLVGKLGDEAESEPSPERL
jgi:predicted deacylase